MAMYIHRMVRTQLYLDDAIHRRLQALARRQGRTLSELVRDALTQTYGKPHADERETSLRAIEGLWRDRDDLGDSAAYVRRLRRDTHRVRRPRR
jgi:predicted transcriptional regulator